MLALAGGHYATAANVRDQIAVNTIHTLCIRGLMKRQGRTASLTPRGRDVAGILHRRAERLRAHLKDSA
ncbi:hypothetical protein DYH55_02585 [Methylovirgula sp. 4M-Z18]|nr:hypothetical protein DYH55_02585 [Methylovirgula sp. 4M-Z18]